MSTFADGAVAALNGFCKEVIGQVRKTVVQDLPLVAAGGTVTYDIPALLGANVGLYNLSTLQSNVTAATPGRPYYNSEAVADVKTTAANVVTITNNFSSQLNLHVQISVCLKKPA